MTRSLKKFNYFSNKNYKQLIKFQFNFVEDLSEKHKIKLQKRFVDKGFFLIFSKNIIITALMVGFYFLIYNGFNFKSLFIKESMIGFKIGEFIVTKQLGMKIHLEKKKKRKSIK
jgi:ribosomal protein S19